MVDVALSAGLFAKRPPTPPRESTAKLPNDSSFLSSGIGHLGLLDTPDESPSSSAEYFKGSSETHRKKVAFSGWTQYHRPLSIGNKGYESDDQIRRIPPSRECNPSKSILRPYIDNGSSDSSNDLLGFEQGSLQGMLRSAALHLGSDSRSSRLDAYSTLLACLSAYDDIPDAENLAEKVVEIAVAMRRDVLARNEDGAPDTQLATQALKLLTVFLCTKITATLLPDDFCAFILEQALVRIEDQASPKILVTHYMHLAEKQKFSARIMTTDRANRLLTALDGVTLRIQGNRVVGHRLNIYQRLLAQSRPVMISRVASWIDHLVAGMSSSIKDIRARAIAFGMEAGLRLGTTQTVSQACIDVFNRESPSGRKVVEFLSERLIEMMSAREGGVQVPQIWSVVILLLRSRRRQIERWEHLKAWLVIIQRCFNSGDAQIKFQANLAWDRLIYAVDIDTTISNSMAKMLKQPIVSQLERKPNEKNSKLAKQVARSSYCTLLYYALRPTASHAQLDQYWDLYIAEMVPTCFVSGKAEIDHACDILAALLSNSSLPRIWDENKANLNGPVKAEELPCLDAKWVRSRVSRVLQVFDKLSSLADWRFGGSGAGPILLVWRSFMSALGNAGSKEVKVSTESMIAIAQITNHVKHLLDQQDPEEQHVSDNLKKFDVLVSEAVAKIGYIPFQEHRLLLTPLRSFEASAETPSSRSTCKPGSLDSPATHLMKLLLSVGRGVDTQSYESAVRNVLLISLQSTASRRTQLSVLRNQARLLSTDDYTCSLEAKTVFWRVLAEATTSALRLPKASEIHNASPQYPGHDYREAVKILELGLQQQSMAILPSWKALHVPICQSLEEDAGIGGIIILVTEPLASVICKELVKQCDDSLLAVVVSLVENLQWPQSRQAMERAEAQLWGALQLHQKTMSVDPFDHAYNMMDVAHKESYATLEKLNRTIVASFLSAVTSVLTSCPKTICRTFLGRIQQGLGVWIEDPKGIMRGSSDCLLSKVETMLEAIGLVIESAPVIDNSFLSSIQSLMASGLRSRHKFVLNKFVLLWNRTFGSVDSLEYPEELQTVLRKLTSVVDIQVPGFPDVDDDEIMSSPLHFVDSQEGEGEELSFPDTIMNAQPFTKGRSSCFDTPSKRLALSETANSIGASNGSPQPLSARRVVKTTPKARFRHDDSQIQFAAIESSPLPADAIDVQMLTDRQREVKERQVLEAAMFPEIRSSPQSGAAEYNLPTLAFSSRPPPARSFTDDNNSPTFPPDATMNEFLGSSPTPSSNKKNSKDLYSDDGPPSSPPFISSHLQVRQEIMASAKEDDQDMRSKSTEAEEDGKSRNDTAEQSTMECVSEVATSGPIVGLNDLEKEDNNSQDSHYVPDAILMSDCDVFVDAPTDHSLDEATARVEENGTTFAAASEPAHEAFTHTRSSPSGANENDHEVSRVLNSFQSGESSYVPTEDDQVTAQLVNEMALASSQNTKECPPMSERRKKLKRKSKSGFSTRKRGKFAATPFSTQTSEVASGEVVADCVLIDVRPAPVSVGSSVPVPLIKKERSASPNDLASIPQAIEETPIVAKRSLKRTRSSNASQSSNQEAASVRRSTRKTNPGAGPDRKVSRRSSQLSESLTSSPVAPYTSAQDCDMETAETGAAVHSVSSPDEAAARPLAVPATDISQVVGPHEGDTSAGAGDGDPAQEPADVPPTADGILQRFRTMLSNIRRIALRPEEERALVGVLFESVQQVHEAGRRNTGI